MTLEEQLKKANDEIKALKSKLNFSFITCSKTLNPEWLSKDDIGSRKRELFLSVMNYNVFEMPNSDKSIFHDTLKGFEEFSKLKGYVVFLSIDTSLDNKIAFKFDLPDGSSRWSSNKIKKDLDDYLERITENLGVEDISVKCSKLQESQLKSTLKNRMLLIQHTYSSQKHVHMNEVVKKDKEIKFGREKICQLEHKLKTMEGEKKINDTEMAMLELELSDTKLEFQMLENVSMSKDTVIEFLKDTVNKSLACDKQVINVKGDMYMGEETHKIKATNSNVIVQSNNSSQTINQNYKIEEILSKIVSIAESDELVTKTQFLKVVASVEAIKCEILDPAPKESEIKEHINFIGSIASISSLASQLVPLMPVLF